MFFFKWDVFVYPRIFRVTVNSVYKFSNMNLLASILL